MPAGYALVWTPTFKRNARRFLKQHRDLAGDFSAVLHLLEQNPEDPRLRLHQLQGKLAGKQAVSLSYSYRIVLKLEITERDIYLYDVGSHDAVYL